VNPDLILLLGGIAVLLVGGVLVALWAMRGGTPRAEESPAAAYPPAEESRARLEQAGWSVRVWPVPLGVRVSATSDKGRLLFASGATAAEALGRLCRLAEALSLLGTEEADDS
jgi:hypothetical protein